MDEQEILAKIKEVIADKLDVDIADNLDGGTEDEFLKSSFVDDLGADSLDVVELIMGLEDQFGIEISDEDAEKLVTVKDAVKFIQDHAEAEV
ncbi:MAG: acyl carrier protein [Deinococcales bacterium]